MTEPERGQPAWRPTRRLFFALWPDDGTRRMLARATRKAVKRSGGRPVPARHLHATLAFLGNQPADLFADIVRAGQAVASTPVDLVLDRFGYFARPRVFWIGPGDCPPPLALLSNNLWDRMESLGIERDLSPFRPHVTLARKVAALPEVPPPEPLNWKISGFALIESVTDQRGAVYTVAQRFPV